MGMAESSFIASGATGDKITFAQEIGGENTVSDAEIIDDTEGGDITRDAWVRRVAKMAFESKCFG